MSERTETAAADFPVDYDVGHPKFLYAVKGITIPEQRAKRLLLKNAHGLPPIANYKDL